MAIICQAQFFKKLNPYFKVNVMRVNKIIALLLGVVFSQSHTTLAEESWTPVNGISMEKQGADLLNSTYLYLFGQGGSSTLDYLNIRLTDNVVTDKTVMYWGPSNFSSTTATVNLGNFSWTLNGAPALDSFRTKSSNPQRNLSVTGSKQSSLILNGKNYGMKLVPCNNNIFA